MNSLVKWRDIGEDEVKEAVISPARIESSRGERKNAYKQIGGKRLKVTFMEESGRIVIITAIDKSR